MLCKKKLELHGLRHLTSFDMSKLDINTDKSRREANLYDAVAGRVTSQGFYSGPNTRSDTGRQHTLAIAPPEEILYRRKDAPVRYEEDDEYFQDRHLRPDQKLPESDLLKTIHAYVADYYARTTPDEGRSDERSLDETALIAMGILLEEAAAKCIGKTGDLALVEPR